MISRLCCSAAFVVACVHGQTFDAVSIKPANPNQPDGRIVVGGLAPIGGPGSGDPGRIRYPIINLKLLLAFAYDVKDHQIAGPGWLDSEFFEIQAVMSADATKEQLRIMLQNMLAERFRLQMHRESKKGAGYSLVVAKGGPKMKESIVAVPVDGGDARLGPAVPSRVGSDGFPIRPNVPASGPGLWTTVGTKGIRITGRQRPMGDLAHTLGAFMRQPVSDATGLTAEYDFILTCAPPDLSAGIAGLPDIFSALQSQLGLKLESKKSPLDTIVVDHMDKSPTAN